MFLGQQPYFSFGELDRERQIVCLCMCVSVCVHVRVRMTACLRACVRACVCAHDCVTTCLCVFVCARMRMSPGLHSYLLARVCALHVHSYLPYANRLSL